MFTLGAFSGDNSWVAIEYDRYILWDIQRSGLHCRSSATPIVVSAECAHRLRYSYRATLKTIVAVSIAGYCKKCICRIDAKELRRGCQNAPRKCKFIYPQFALGHAQCRATCVISCAFIARQDTFYMHTSSRARDPSYLCIASIYLIARERGRQLLPSRYFISLRLLPLPVFTGVTSLPPRLTRAANSATRTRISLDGSVNSSSSASWGNVSVARLRSEKSELKEW